MPIKVKCKCGTGFAAKDELAGKRVKCPKCKQLLQIPTLDQANAANPAAAAKSAPPKRANSVRNPASGAAPGGKKPSVNMNKNLGPSTAVAGGSRAGTVAGNLGDPLADLLDEIGVQGIQNEPTCPSCETLVTPGARLCVNCGFNFETGEKLRTVSYDEDDQYAGMSETDKMLAKAEREIDDMPISGDNEDFGDGAGAYLVAGAVALIALTVTGISLAIVMSLQQMGKSGQTLQMATVASSLILLGTYLWMVIAAFMTEAKMGVMCVFIPGFVFIYSILYKHWFATMLMVMGGAVNAVCLLIISYS